jgi:hypothetical protein
MNEGQQQQIHCENPDCKKDFVAEIPMPEVINTLSLSILAWAHPELALCPHCGQGHQMAVMRIGDVSVGWKGVKTNRSAGLVIPPAGFKLPKIGG